MRGPNLANVDFSITKDTPLKFLGEDGKLEFRMETYNLFNKGNFANPVARLIPTLGTGANQLQPGQAFNAITGGTFGQVQQTVESSVGLGAQRQIQLSLRFNF